MTRSVASVTSDTSLEAAVRMMLDMHISGLPVIDGVGTLIGIVTEGDLLRRVELGTDAHRTRWLEFLLGPSRLAADYVVTHSRVVKDVMTTEVASVTETTSLQDVVALMEKRRVKRVPVVADGRLVGIVSRADLLRNLAGMLAQCHVDAPGGGKRSDADVRAAVLADFARQPWALNAGIQVAVADGVVTLEGTLLEQPDRAAMRVLAENVPGVTSVRDRTQWVEPYSGMTFGAP